MNFRARTALFFSYRYRYMRQPRQRMTIHFSLLPNLLASHLKSFISTPHIPLPIEEKNSRKNHIKNTNTHSGGEETQRIDATPRKLNKSKLLWNSCRFYYFTYPSRKYDNWSNPHGKFRVFWIFGGKNSEKRTSTLTLCSRLTFFHMHVANCEYTLRPVALSNSI